MKSATGAASFLLVTAVTTTVFYFDSTSNTQANLPQGAFDFKTQIENFSTFSFSMRYFLEGYGHDDVVRLVFRTNSDGDIAIDTIGGARDRYVYKDNKLQWNRQGEDGPTRLEEYEPMVADIWGHIRSGNSVWLAREPEFYGFENGSGKDWTEIQLPFEWSTGVHVFLSFISGTSTPVRLKVFTPVSTEPWNITISDMEFDRTFLPQAFSTNPPPFNLPFNYDRDHLLDSKEGGPSSPGTLQPLRPGEPMLP